MRRVTFIIGLICAGLGLLARAPWLSAEAAQEKAVAAFTASWSGVADGCGVNCKGCGAVGAERATFGWRVELEYACGLRPADLPEYHQRTTLYVSPVGTVHGLTQP